MPYYKNKETNKTRYCLVFFCLCLLTGCADTARVAAPKINFEGNRAVSVLFNPGESGGKFQIYLAGENAYPVLGNLEKKKEWYRFTPVVPFSQGKTYVIMDGDLPVTSFSVPHTEKDITAPEVVAIYPQNDTIPENLLKCYVQFSQPMQAVGKALDFITVYQQTGDTEKEIGVFLDMEAELWDKDHTRLTLWVDPGRVKTGLIPNEAKGKPLMAGNSYRLVISRDWESAQGIPLSRDFQKLYYAGLADRTKPDPGNWDFRIPKAQTHAPFEILFGEKVDLVVAREAFMLTDYMGNPVVGEWAVRPDENSIVFKSEEPWRAGNYKLLLDPRLEDLAGNNLSRLFETDLKGGETPGTGDYQINFPFTISY